ncbi:MAG: DUF6249 domain-containing protein [Woeseiaceae bacterium]|nr:DUF6249 domain-containing protein [Woeseiaceae bacterium]
MVEEFIGLAAVLGPVVLVGIFLWFRYRSRLDMQQTIRLALDKGQELSPELIDRLGHPKRSQNYDLRLALIWLAIAFGLVLCGAAAPDPSGNAFRGCLAGAAFPFAIGVAYLLIWRFAGRD